MFLNLLFSQLLCISSHDKLAFIKYYLTSFSVSPNSSVAVFPSTVTVNYGGAASFNCIANGGPNNVLLWLRLDLINMSDPLFLNVTSLLTTLPVQVDQILTTLENVTLATGPWLNITSINATEDGGSYTCLVINQAGFDIGVGQLYVYLEIVEQPVNQTVRVGENVTFVFRAESFPEPTYQWEKNTDDGFEILPGENSSALVFSPVEFGNFGEYRCIANASVIMDSATSDAVILTGMSCVAKT